MKQKVIWFSPSDDFDWTTHKYHLDQNLQLVVKRFSSCIHQHANRHVCHLFIIILPDDDRSACACMGTWWMWCWGYCTACSMTRISPPWLSVWSQIFISSDERGFIAHQLLEGLHLLDETSIWLDIYSSNLLFILLFLQNCCYNVGAARS